VPSPREVHVDQCLTNVACHYPALLEGFIADQIFPTVPVKGETGEYRLFGTEELWPIGDTIGDRSEAAEVDWHTSTSTYRCVARALKTFVSSRSIKNSDPAVRPLVTGTNKVARSLLLNREIRCVAAVAAAITATSNTTALSAAWSTTATGTPLKNFADTAESMRVLTGRKPNLLVINPDVIPTMLETAEWKDKVKYTHGDLVETHGAIPTKIAGMRVLIPQAHKVATDIVQTTYDGGATLTAASSIWTAKACYLLYVNPRPSIDDPSFGYNLECTPWRTRKWYDPNRGLGGGWYVQSEYQAVQKYVCAEHAWSLTGCIT
jgi:hypothetical protein